MKNKTPLLLGLSLLVMASLSSLRAQQQNSPDDVLTPEAFSTILKDEWIYLRDATDQLVKDTEKRGEFETSPEFQARVARTRQLFLEKLNGRIKDTKMGSRVFSVWFKATLASYDADAGIYAVTCSETAEAPYDIPTVGCTIPSNAYVEMADSIRGGYRTSSIRLKFHPNFQWMVARNEAMAAKAGEQNIFFRVRFTVNMSQEKITTKARIRIIPTEISLIDQQNKYVFWKEVLR
jgi:hypothetical protein